MLYCYLRKQSKRCAQNTPVSNKKQQNDPFLILYNLDKYKYKYVYDEGQICALAAGRFATLTRSAQLSAPYGCHGDIGLVTDCIMTGASSAAGVMY